MLFRNIKSRPPTFLIFSSSWSIRMTHLRIRWRRSSLALLATILSGARLPQVVIGKTVQGRDLVIRMYRAGEDLRGAHILFISASERKRLPMILAGLRGSSVLTVADTAGFLEAGGMIQFSVRKRPRPVCDQCGCHQPGQAENEFQVAKSGEGSWRKRQGTAATERSLVDRG